MASMGFEETMRHKTPEEISKEGIRAHTFEDQWAHPIPLHTREQVVNMYDIKPEAQKTEIPTLVVPGWLGTPQKFKENMRALVSAGRRSISIDAPHGIEHEIRVPEHMEHVADAELRRIAAFMTGLDAAGVEKTDALGHSEGGLDIMLAAAIYPDRFRNLVLIDPAGMIGKNNALFLAARFRWDKLKEFVQGKWGGTLDRRAVAVKTPGSSTFDVARAFGEVRSIAAADIVDLLTYVKSLGIGVLVITGAGDAAFPIKWMGMEIEDQIIAAVGKRDDVYVKDNERLGKITEKVLDGFISVKGTHNDFRLHAPTYTRIAEGLMSTLEEKQAKSSKDSSTTALT